MSFKIKHIFAIRPSNSTLKYLLKRNENLCSHKTLYENIYNSFPQKLDCQKLETIQMSFNW